MGSQKSREIASNAVLAWYFEKFQEYLAADKGAFGRPALEEGTTRRVTIHRARLC